MAKMQEVFQDARKKKLFIAIICAFFGMLMMPRGDSAAMSVFVFPSVASGVAFGFAIAQLVELTKAWAGKGMNKVDEAKNES